ncbi:MAG: hypothetical protein E7288_04190 [Lachnospiraceae bacterium]|nr:hypothetical protein [Lachnospiraceae bacterium]
MEPLNWHGFLTTPSLKTLQNKKDISNFPGLLRAMHSRNPTQNSHITELSFRFYANFLVCSKVTKQSMCKHI